MFKVLDKNSKSAIVKMDIETFKKLEEINEIPLDDYDILFDPPANSEDLLKAFK